jgi:hypothetical protein
LIVKFIDYSFKFLIRCHVVYVKLTVSDICYKCNDLDGDTAINLN